MKKTSQKSFYQFYNFLIWISLVVFIIIFLFSLINSFYTPTQKRVNDARISSLAWAMENTKLRQNRVYTKKQYVNESQLIVGNVQWDCSGCGQDDMPSNILGVDRKTVLATYYRMFKTIIIPANDNQIASLKILVGLSRSFYILMILFAIFQVKLMMDTVQKQNYWNPINAKRIQILGLLMFLAPLLIRLNNFLLEKYLIKVFALDKLKFVNADDYSIWLWIVGGILCLTFANVLSKGNELKQENDLTI
jgi:hypothetical protein